MLICIMTYLQV